MWGAVPMIVAGMYPGARPIVRAIRFSAISPVAKACSGIIRADLSCVLIIHEALWLNIGIPGIFGVSIEVIVIHWQLRETIHGVFDEWRCMGLGYWS